MSNNVELVHELHDYSIVALSLWPLVATFASFDLKDGEAEFNPRFNLLVGGALALFILLFHALPMLLLYTGQTNPLASLRNSAFASLFVSPGFIAVAIQGVAFNLMPVAGDDPSARAVRSLNYWVAVIIILLSCVWLHILQNGDTHRG